MRPCQHCKNVFANSFARMKQHKKTDAHVGIPLFEMMANLSQLKKVLSKTTYHISLISIPLWMLYPLNSFPFFEKLSTYVKKGHYSIQIFALLKSLVWLMSPDTNLGNTECIFNYRLMSEATVEYFFSSLTVLYWES